MRDVTEIKELEEFLEGYEKSNWSRMDLYLAEKVKEQQKEIERLKTMLLKSDGMKVCLIGVDKDE